MDLNKPIPSLRTTTGWEKVRICETGEKLISLGKSTNPEFFIIFPEYYLKKVRGSVKEMYLRESVYLRLLEAARLLPNGYKFVIIDAWRPYEVQKTLFDEYYLKLSQENKDLDDNEVFCLTRKFVSFPSIDELCPSPHFTGAAIDLTIADKEKRYLFMGTEFDDFTEKAYTRYYEEKLERGSRLDEAESLALNNRRILYHIMSAAGFTNYSCEWWHYDFGNQFWGMVKGEKAMYGKACNMGEGT